MKIEPTKKRSTACQHIIHPITDLVCSGLCFRRSLIALPQSDDLSGNPPFLCCYFYCGRRFFRYFYIIFIQANSIL